MLQAVGLRSQGACWSGAPSPRAAKVANSPGVREDVPLSVDEGLAKGRFHPKHLYSIGGLERDPLLAVTARPVVETTAAVVGVD